MNVSVVLEDIEGKKKDAKMTEDEIFTAKEELQKITNEVNSTWKLFMKRKRKK